MTGWFHFPVPKKDGKVRICGDYKVNINQALDVNQYPLPRPEDVFATLGGGNKFLKLDLSEAYQQPWTSNRPCMSPSILTTACTYHYKWLHFGVASAPALFLYVTINTHKGLYHYKQLLFGVASAPVLFQKLIDMVLQGIPHICTSFAIYAHLCSTLAWKFPRTRFLHQTFRPHYGGLLWWQ